jgi:hypothetical protein
VLRNVDKNYLFLPLMGINKSMALFEQKSPVNSPI